MKIYIKDSGVYLGSIKSKPFESGTVNIAWNYRCHIYWLSKEISLKTIIKCKYFEKYWHFLK